MVEYSFQAGQTDLLDNIFQSLADATRRDILSRVAKKELSISEIAKRYDLTFAAVSKHLKVLEKAKLIVKRRQGREQYVQMAPATVRTATQVLEYYENLWEARFDSLDNYLQKIQNEGKDK